MHPHQKRLLQLFGLVTLLVAGLIPGLGVAADSDDPAAELPALTVAGRSARRTIRQSPVAVDVIEGRELVDAASVSGELGQALAILLPSFNFPRQSNSVTSDHVRSAQLRGMSPDQVLVLVNGKRRHPSAVVNDNTKIGRGTNAFDFNTIPVSAIRRVEVLRDGAGAQYGSDAIAGVINIVLDDRFAGGRLDVLAGVHHTRVGPIDETVTDGETGSVAISHGQAIGAGGLHYGLELHRREPTNRAGFDRVSPFIPQTEANLAFQGQRTHRVGDPETRELKTWFNGAWPVGSGQWYAFGTLAWRDSEGAAVYRYPDSNQNVPAIFPQGFRPVTLGENLDVGLTAGREFLLGDWSLDTAVSLGRNRFEFGVKNSLNPSLGPASPTRFDSGTFEFEQAQISLEAGRELAIDGLDASLGLVLGADFRFEGFQSRPGDPSSFAIGDFEYPPPVAEQVGFPDIGAQGAKGLSPEDAARITRQVAGIFGEASLNPRPDLTLDVAGRIEHYSDFGTTVDGKLSGLYQPDPRIGLRASVATGFRAPSLSQIGWSRRDNTFGPGGERIASRLVRPDSPIARALGFRDLDEETSLSTSVGLVGQTEGGLRYAIDAFSIRVDDRITLSESIQDPALIDAIQDLPGGQGVQALSIFTNAVDTRTRGVELNAGYATELAGWRLDFDGGYTRARTDVRSVNPPPAAVQAISPDAQLIGVEQFNTLETATPRDQWVISARAERGAWHGLVRTRHYGSVVREFTFARQRFDAETAVDVELGWRVGAQVRLAAGAQNLFDQRPDPSGQANDFFGNFAFDPLHPVGINGRFLYLRAGYDF